MPKGYEKADSPVGGICDAIRAGVPLARAAKLGGISVQTLLRWDAESPVVHAQLEAAQAAARAPQPRELPPGWAEAVAISAGTDAPEPTPSPEADRWARIREEAAALAPGLAGLYRWVDGLLASKGFPPTSPWWRSTLEAFWASDARWLVILAGRGAGKSSTLCRIAVVEALFAERSVPPGQTWIWPFLSVLKADARRRLDEIEAILKALGVEAKRSTPEGVPTLSCVDATGNQIAFVSIAATVAGVSGPSAIGFVGDEVAKWRDEDTGANPAAEVIKSGRQMFRGRAGIHGYLVSSAWGEFGIHHEMVTAGDTALTRVARLGDEGYATAMDGFARAAAYEQDAGKRAEIEAHARGLTPQSSAIPTFLANPTITPESTRADEPDVATWLREVASVPTGEQGAGFFDSDRLRAACELRVEHGSGECFAGIDTGAKRNPAALAIVERITLHDGAVRYRPVLLRKWTPTMGAPLDLRLVVLPEMARICRAHGCWEWHSDGWASDAIDLVAAEHGMSTRYVSTSTVHDDQYVPVDAAINRGEVALGASLHGLDEAVRQLRAVKRAPRGDAGWRMILPEEGPDHGELGQVLVRALAAAGAGRVEPVAFDGLMGSGGRYAGLRG